MTEFVGNIPLPFWIESHRWLFWPIYIVLIFLFVILSLYDHHNKPALEPSSPKEFSKSSIESAAYPPFFVWRFRIAGSAKGKANCGLGAGNAILS